MTYEYLCSACSHQWEAEQPISAEPLKKCPKCRKNTAKRQVSGGAGFILKGGGWYADGYGNSSKGARDASGGGASSGGEAKVEPPAADKAKPDQPKPEPTKPDKPKTDKPKAGKQAAA